MATIPNKKGYHDFVALIIILVSNSKMLKKAMNNGANQKNIDSPNRCYPIAILSTSSAKTLLKQKKRLDVWEE